MWIEAKGAGVDQKCDPDQIQARRARCGLAVMIELGCLVREIAGGPTQANGITGGQGRISFANEATARVSGQLGERGPGPAHCRRLSQDLEGLAEVVAAFIVGRWLQRGQLPNAVCVAEQGLVIQAPGSATGQDLAHLRSRRCQVPAPPKRVGRREERPQQNE